MGRKKQWDERLHLTLPAGAKERMDAVLREGEDRLALVRAALEREIVLRERDSARRGGRRSAGIGRAPSKSRADTD